MLYRFLSCTKKIKLKNTTTMKSIYSKSRRSFIGKMAKGIALSTIAVSSFDTFGSRSTSEESSHNPSFQKNIRIGIIGAENSHTIGYGTLFNIEKKFPRVEVLYVWGETDEFARTAKEQGKIPNIVKDPKEMLGKIDALIVDHRHPKYHLEAALPFVKEKIPTYIDKPFCYRTG